MRTTDESHVTPVPVGAQPAQPSLLTLDDAIELALLQNFRLTDSGEGLERARLSLGMAQAEFPTP